MDVNQIPPGSAVELAVESSVIKAENEKKATNGASETEVKRYLSSIFDVTKGGEIIVHTPTVQGHYVALARSVVYILTINTNAGIFETRCQLINKGKLENFAVYIFKPIDAIKKVQRREYYRFDCFLLVSIMPITRDIALLPSSALIDEAIETMESDLRDVSYGNIVDISGGGARFTTKVYVDTDSYMLLKFELSDQTGVTQMELVARRVKSEYKEEDGIYENRVEFIFKENSERERIIKYIFDEERRIRKKNQG